MQVDPLVALLVGALGAAVLGIVGALLGAWIQSRREHQRWIREQRLAAYIEFLQATELYPNAGDREIARSVYEYRERFDAAQSAIELLGPDDVTVAAVEHSLAMLERSDAVLGPGVLADQRKAAQHKYASTRLTLIRVARECLHIKS